MAIQRSGNLVQMECDDCGTTFDRGDSSRDFHDLIASAKANGWQVQQADGGWEHRCSSCCSGSRLDAARRMFGRKV